MSLIKISGGGKIINANISKNVLIGGETMIDNEGEIEWVNLEGNVHITSYQTNEKRWFEKPFGIVLLGLVITVVGGGLLYHFGWL